MERRAVYRLAYVVSFFLIVLAGPVQAQFTPQTGLDVEELTIVTDEGQEHTFQVEMARTRSEQAMGLMYRQEMAADAGMLFTFDSAQPRRFWTMNTFLSLDMVFIGEDGRIVTIARETRPFDAARGPDTHGSDGPATAVLEINAGVAEALGIEVGDLVRHGHFGTAPDQADEDTGDDAADE
jgi:hypothetical protein